MTVEELSREIMRLDHDERAHMIDLIIEYAEADDDQEWERLWRAEVQRRRDGEATGLNGTVPAETVFANARVRSL